MLSPAGFNVGGVNPWFDRAAQRARAYDVGEGRTVMAMTPPYFLTTKLVAFADRGPDAQSSKDAEDIVTLLVEVPDLVDQVDAEGLRAEVKALWGPHPSPSTLCAQATYRTWWTGISTHARRVIATLSSQRSARSSAGACNIRGEAVTQPAPGLE